MQSNNKKSETLKFQILYNFNWFEVEFESESRDRNLLMEVVFDDLHLDTAVLYTNNSEFYRDIKNAMQNNANSFWDDKDEINNVPTLAYQRENTTTGAFHAIITNSITHGENKTKQN